MSAESRPDAVHTEGLRIVGPQGPIVPGLDLTVTRGTTLGIVGESGSGKSMLVKALTGLLPRDVRASGSYRLDQTQVDLAGGERAWSSVRGRRAVLVLQDPFTSLDPMRRCGAQVLDAVPDARRWRRRERHADAVRRLAEVGLPERVARQYPHELSGGMRQRVAIAAALAREPELLIADEPTTALDVTTQRDVLDLLSALQAARRMTLVLITHDLALARERCDELVVMYAGRVVERGPADEVFASAAHPYTQALHAATPPVDVRLDRLPAIPGSVPRASDAPTCPFVERCPVAVDRCRAEPVALAPVPGAPGRAAACLLAGTDGPDGADGTDGTGERPATSDAPAALAPAGAEPVDPTEPLSDETPLLRVDSVIKRFPGAPGPAVDDVSVVVRAGESVGIVGESGSGKTTLARCVVGLERPDAGSVRVTVDHAEREPGPRDVQIVFQDPYSALNPALTVGATLREALAVAPPSRGPAATVEQLLGLVGLPAHYARRRPARLSGGERQRVAIARAVAPGPRVLLCDESVSALDVSVQAQVLNLLADLRARLGLAVLFVSHDLAVVRQATDRVYVMRAGRVVEHGATERVLAEPRHEYTRALLASLPGRPAAGSAPIPMEVRP